MVSWSMVPTVVARCRIGALIIWGHWVSVWGGCFYRSGSRTNLSLPVNRALCKAFCQKIEFLGISRPKVGIDRIEVFAFAIADAGFDHARPAAAQILQLDDRADMTEGLRAEWNAL